MCTVFILEDIFWRLEIYDDTNFIDETFGIDSSNFTITNPYWISLNDSKEQFEELFKLKYEEFEFEDENKS